MKTKNILTYLLILVFLVACGPTAISPEAVHSWSNNGMLFTTQVVDGKRSIGVFQGQATILTEGIEDGEPTWSPDGKKIAFSSYRGGTNSQIYVMDADGSNVEALTTRGSNFSPTWSAYGSQIAFTDGHQLFTMNSDGSNVNMITLYDTGLYGLSWSPDGTKIAFTSDIPGKGAAIFTIDTSDWKTSQLTDGTRDSQPSWSPDSKQIAFISDRLDPCDPTKTVCYSSIFIMDADGTNPHVVVTDNYTNILPVWSPDGAHISFTKETWQQELFTDPRMKHVGIYTINLATKEVIQINRSK